MTATTKSNFSQDVSNGSGMQAEVDLSPNTARSRGLLSSVCIIATCTLAMVANISNSTTVSIALPTIENDLHIEQVRLQWIVSAYPLSAGCLLLLFGRLSDLYGRKKLFIAGSLWLIAFTLGSSFAPDSLTLDILRGIQGIGAAATIPASIGTLAHAFPPSRLQAIAFSTFAAGAPLGGALGFALGGTLTELTERSWRSPFYLSCALTFVSLVGAIISFDADTPSTEQDQRVDWIGGILVTVGLVLIVFVLGQGEVAPNQWATPYIIVLLLLGAIITALFIIWQYHLERIHDLLAVSSSGDTKTNVGDISCSSSACPTPTTPMHLFWAGNTESLPPWSRFLQKWLPSPPPLMRLSLWTRAHGKVAAVLTIAFLNWCCFMGYNYWVGLYYQNFLRLSPLQTVARLCPMFVTGVLCNVVVASVVSRVPMVILVVVGTALTSTAALLFAVIDPNAVYWAFGFPAAVASVFGADFVFASGMIYVSRESKPHEQSVSGAVFQTITQLGTSLGVAVSTVVFNRVNKNRTIPHANVHWDIMLPSYHAAEWTNFAFGVLATVIGLVCLRGIGIIGHQTPTETKATEGHNSEKDATAHA